MNKVLWIFIAFAFGIMLFVSIQDKLPPELAILKNDGAVPAATVPASGQVKVQSLAGWTVRQQGTALEATRRFSGDLKVGSSSYDVPQLGILCNAGKLDARIDSRLPTTGARATRVVIDGQTQQWDKGQGTNLFPSSAVDFVRYLESRERVSITLSYLDLGTQSTTLDTKDMRQLIAAFPPTCQ
ncbi:hypothetical protein [Burkholderia cenocepacia]|uniref:hypothetical protein n=1 Tax=Burkholderia cenocepacia TaxID=95486 RepID=UPI0007615419|nr:hypothetical protein [Burkholderia cenocepacia]KWU17849.1 hypothetical protein AS149_14105 [Burkholderia cenocepacia]